jgi:hypothetical protein
MSKDPAENMEDMIEATIRRVAASKAARLPDVIEDAPDPDEGRGESGPDLHLVPPTEDDPPTVASAARPATDEDRIEATLRRIKAQQAARAVEDAPEPEAGHGGSGPDLHLVPATGDDPLAVAPAVRPAADENLIEATLRRIEAQQAALALEAAAEETSVHDAAPEREPSLDLHVVRSDDNGHGDVISPSAASTARAPRNLDVAPEPERGVSEAAGSPRPDIAALRRDVEDIRAQLCELTERVDTMLASSPEQPRRSTRQPARPAAPPSSGTSGDDWDDPPVIQRLDTGLPPRPAILRDASPAPDPTARIEGPAPVAPAASEVRSNAPPPHVDDAPKRGFDLLPRTYRITVEDKRRGVDLVPLHRALLGMAGVRDMSLLSYSNGTAIVALEATAEIAPDALGAAVAHAMAREVKVEVHNEQTMVIKLAED